MKVARNPFIHKVEDVPEAIQEEFTELTNDSFAKDVSLLQTRGVLG